MSDKGSAVPTFSQFSRGENGPNNSVPTVKLVTNAPGNLHPNVLAFQAATSNSDNTSGSASDSSNYVSALQSFQTEKNLGSSDDAGSHVGSSSGGSAGVSNSSSSIHISSNQNTLKPSRSSDLSHMYLSEERSPSPAVSHVSDNSHKLISQYLGENSDKLVPRMKTIEMYRQNAKKSSDPYVLFQFAQYILQTALLMDEDDVDNPRDLSACGISNFDAVQKELLKEAARYLKKLSDKGYTDAQYLLADAYSSGALGKINNNKAFQLFQVAAKHGHVESCYRTSHCYEDGIGTQRDAKKAIQFLKSAASRNHPAAMYKLGCYSYYGKMGLGKDDNTKKAGIKWLTIAVSKANELTCAAPYELGRIYENGFKDIVIPDKKYALELYVQAASLGHIPSAFILGKAYELGVDIPQDANLSIHYYTQAALGGHADAMLAMCAWYLVGAEPYLQKDLNEAFAWALRAANLGLPKAQYAIGHFLEKGIGCEIDLEESQKWIQKAARNGDLRAKQKIGNNVEVEKNEKDCIIM